MENYIGRLLDNRYEILDVIGVGGMAVVYKARDHRLKRLVAVKILKDEYSQNDDFRKRFNAESQAVAMLSHPNIVSVYDVSEYEGVNFIVMELIDGITLKQYSERRGVLTWRETLHFSLQIAKALEHAHGRGIVHRDIKPHNIMILKDGSVKVADFGIARFVTSSNTLTREALGSVHYISPEQAKGGKTDCRSDIYSLGVVMYEMMTGKLPFDGETPVAVAIQHINGKAQLPRELNEQIPVGMEQIIMHAMCADLGTRYQSATDLLNDLEEFRKNPEITFNFVPFASSDSNLTSAPEKSTQADRTVQKQTKKSAEAAKKQSEKGEKKWVIFIAAVCGVLLIFLGIIFFKYLWPMLNGESDTITVPNFIGEDADSILPSEYPDIQFDWTFEYSDSVEVYHVIGQEPAPDTKIEKGQTILLTISKGQETMKMINLVGKTVDEAESELNGMSLKTLKIDLQYEENEDYETGLIIKTDPVEGIVLTGDETITLYVSLGKSDYVELRTVPNCKGYQLESAELMLSNAGLEYSVNLVENDAIAGTVVSQSIAGGTTVESGTKVNLTVSLGPSESSGEPITSNSNG